MEKAWSKREALRKSLKCDEFTSWKELCAAHPEARADDRGLRWFEYNRKRAVQKLRLRYGSHVYPVAIVYVGRSYQDVYARHRGIPRCVRMDKVHWQALDRSRRPAS